MKPIFPFYGSKWRDAKRYGPPRHDTVIEPFAGSAGYSTFYAPRNVMLFDVDPYIVGVWSYLIRVSAAEVLALPDLVAGQSVDDFPQLPQEARWLIGYWLNRGSAQPKKTQTAYSTRVERQQLVWSQRARERIASEIDGIRHWTITLGDWTTAPIRRDATYYVDPPYGVKGRYYRCRDVDLDALGVWCQELPGHVIACEQVGATWLPFSPLASIKSSKGRSHEAIWTNDKQEVAARRERGGRHGAPLRINLAEAERLLREGKTVSEAARAIRCSRAALHHHYTAEDARRFARLGPKRLKQPK